MPKSDLQQVAENLEDYVCAALREEFPDPAERAGKMLDILDAAKAAVAKGIEYGVWEPVGLLNDKLADLAGLAAEALSSKDGSVLEVDDLREVAQLLPGTLPVRVHSLSGHTLRPMRVAVWLVDGQQTVVLLPVGQAVRRLDD